MAGKDTLPRKKAEKTGFSAQIKAGVLPLNHREIIHLKNTDLARQLFYKKIFARLYIFRQHGQALIGRLRPTGGYGGIGQQIYPVETQDGEEVLIPGNKHLQRIFKKYDLVGKWIKIVYVGDKWTHERHKMKIYEVYDWSEKVKRAGFSPLVAAAIAKSQNKKTG